MAQLEYKKVEISKNYLTGWFSIDAAGCLPINYVLLLTDQEEAGGNRFLRLARLMRLLKLLRLIRMSRIMKRYEEILYALESGFTMFKIVVISFTCGHCKSEIGRT